MAYITTNRGKYSVKSLCRVLSISEAGYYKHLRTSPVPPKHANLLAQIYEILNEDPENANCGARRIYNALRLTKGYKGSSGTVYPFAGSGHKYRTCKENGLMIKRKHRPNGITKADSEAQKAEKLIKQDFTAEKPNRKWLSDITEIPCSDGKLYLAVVLDCHDGKIVGFGTDDNMKAELVRDAFELACRKERARGMIFHSDRGSQFTSMLFRSSLARHGAVQSMSGTGRCYDNARTESRFATLKKEKLYKVDTGKMNMTEVKSAVFQYICYYNPRRIYSVNGGYPPEVWRQIYQGTYSGRFAYVKKRIGNAAA
jgi:transposase InsO family protein